MSVVFVISAPSGAGKSTLVTKLREREGNLDFVASITTRPRREHEVEGKAYRFVSRREFDALLAQDEFLEWAEVFGHRYGTPRSAVDQARKDGRDVLLDIDVRGAASLREKLPDAVSVFVLPPGRDTLEQRLRGRASDSGSVIARRLSEAAREVCEYGSYDHVVINDDVDDAVDRLQAILQAERSRPSEMRSAVAPILASFGIAQDQHEEEQA